MRGLGVTVFGNALEGGAADIAASDIVVLGVRMPVPALLSVLATKTTAAGQPYLLLKGQ